MEGWPLLDASMFARLTPLLAPAAAKRAKLLSSNHSTKPIIGHLYKRVIMLCSHQEWHMN